MKKRKHKRGITKRDPNAKSLESVIFRQRIVPNKVRKEPPKVEDYDE